MVPHLAITDTDFAVRVGAPDDDLVVLVEDDYEGAAHGHALNPDVVLQFDFARPLKLTEDGGAPHVHDALVGDGGAGVPGGNLGEAVRPRVVAAFLLGGSRVDPHRPEHVLVRIVADLAEVVGSAGPELPPSTFARVVNEE